MEALNRNNQIERFSGKLINAHDQLYYYALQLTENRNDAEDLVQETSYKALKNYSRLKRNEHQNAWLYTILRNTHINNLRSGHNKNIQLSRDDQESQVLNACCSVYDHPDRVFDRKELKEQIRSLPANYAKPLRLYISGYSYKEIALMTGVPIGTIKSRIHIAREKLKKTYLNN